ncbi:MAG TPA: hypothetical protein VMW47_04650 [Verrucomicrobiae bacterium]|nr:hypothetical protein [Verrucomicrobiae bacterium]
MEQTPDTQTDETVVEQSATSPSTAPGFPIQSRERVRRTRTTALSPGWRWTEAVWLAIGIVDIVLAMDFVFKILAAANTGFVSFVAKLAGSIAAPFQGIFSEQTLTSGHVTHWADVVAIIVYTIAAYIVARLIMLIAGPRSRTTREGDVGR